MTQLTSSSVFLGYESVLLLCRMPVCDNIVISCCK